jgi:hypothetical protein
MNFTETIEGAKGCVFVPFLASLFARLHLEFRTHAPQQSRIGVSGTFAIRIASELNHSPGWVFGTWNKAKLQAVTFGDRKGSDRRSSTRQAACKLTSESFSESRREFTSASQARKRQRTQRLSYIRPQGIRNRGIARLVLLVDAPQTGNRAWELGTPTRNRLPSAMTSTPIKPSGNWNRDLGTPA